MPSPSLTIHMFGPPRVLVYGDPLPRVPTRSVDWLLALLVLRHGRAVDRSWLAGTLWPDSEERQAHNNLRNALVHLRKALGSEGARVQSPTRDTLTLDLNGAESDVVRFDAAIRRRDAESLRAAVAVYIGPLLEGCHEEWVGLERESRAQACLAALERLAREAEQRHDYVEALALLRRAQGLDALRDSIQRALMRVLSAGGDATAALHAYRDYRLLLREQMNIEPDTETVGLYQQIRRQARQTAQRTDASRQEARPPISSPPATSAYHATLPHPLTSLLGREQQTREIAEAIPRFRLVTLVGGGGVGKTRLAIEVARERASAFADGVAFVALASLSDPALLSTFISSTLGIHEAATPEPASLIRALVGWFSTHEVLLVLDNCEHLIEATASFIQTLLERCPDLHILTTSRQRLGLTGEVAWRVPSLPAPDPEQLSEKARNIAETVLEYPSVQLFVERAAMASPGFRVTDKEDGTAVARICHQLDGIPLAIELAAARVGALSVGQIASRLGDRFRLLTGGSRTALPRQQTLRSLIDWSFDLLNEAEKALLCRLSVFQGGWTLESAEAVCAGDPVEEWEALDLLTSLIDKSLAMAKTSGGCVRYWLLETVREYAGEKLRQSGTENVTRDRHLAYYLERARTAALTLEGSDPTPALDFLETEMDNLRAALAWAQVANAKAYLELTAALWPFWEMRGHFSEGRTHLRTALNRTDDDDAPTRAQALLGATTLAKLQSDLEEALAFGQECLERFQTQEDRRGMAAARLALGEAHLVRQDFARAVPLLMEALEYCRQSAWLPGTVQVSLHLGNVHIESRQMRRGRAFIEEGLALAEALGDPRLIARAYQTLGNLELREENYARARPSLEKCLEIHIRLGDRLGIAHALGYLGGLEQYGDVARAIAYCQEQMAIYRELGNAAERAHVLHRLGEIHYQQGEYELARQAYAEALGLFLSFESEVGFEYVRMNLGCALFHLGDAVGAMELYRQALPLYWKARNEEGLVWALERIGIVEALHGDIRKAARLLGAASVRREGMGLPMAPLDKADWEQALDELRAAQGEAAFASLWAEGRTFTIEQAVSYALSQA